MGKESATCRALADAGVPIGHRIDTVATPGMLMSAYALLSKNPRPSEADVRAAMSGNLCRCSGYQSIVSAVTAAGRAHTPQEKQA